jgi:hypothetical protein
VVSRSLQSREAAAPADQGDSVNTHYLPTDAKGAPLIAPCACCRRDVVTSASNLVGNQYFCRCCRERPEAKAA